MNRKEKVPAFIVEHINNRKAAHDNLHESMYAAGLEVYEWYLDNAELFERAWVNGCEAEEKQKHTLLNKNMTVDLNVEEAALITAILHMFDDLRGLPEEFCVPEEQKKARELYEKIDAIRRDTFFGGLLF
ncbi:MAG: hypothetical protein KIB10_06655 [Enterococcus avium]|nr:hypothetical protein [Enterococcus avium]